MALLPNSDKAIFGGNLFIWLIVSGSTKMPVAMSKNAELSTSMDIIEYSCKDFTGKAVRVMDETWEASAEALTNFNPSGSTLGVNAVFATYQAKLPVYFAFGVQSGTTSPSHTLDTTKKYFTGTAVITAMKFTGGENDMSTYSITFKGNGGLTLV